MFLMPDQLRRQWQRLTVCPAMLMLAGTLIHCNIRWHPEGTPHRHDEIEWEWGEPPFDDTPRP
jgi:hypothetical protein